MPRRTPRSGRDARLLSTARREAARRNHEYVGTLHLMVAAVADGRGRGARWLKSLGILRERFREEVENVMPTGAVPNDGDVAALIPLSPLASRVVAEMRRSPEPEEVALLSSLLRPADGNIANVFARIGVPLHQARKTLPTTGSL